MRLFGTSTAGSGSKFILVLLSARDGESRPSVCLFRLISLEHWAKTGGLASGRCTFEEFFKKILGPFT
jgi:hypothetical protein